MSGIGYSMLLRGIEGDISGVIQSPSVADNNSFSLYDDSASKRRRLSMSNSSFDMNTETVKYSDIAKLTSQKDELKIENEQLKDGLRRIKDSHEREKENFVRQLHFLNEENSKLRHSEKDISEKYFEEKKKWMQQQRALEKQIDKAAKAASKSSATGVSSTSTPSAVNPDVALLEKYAKLQESIRTECQKSQSLAKKVFVSNVIFLMKINI
jgi:hypothetical protein